MEATEKQVLAVLEPEASGAARGIYRRVWDRTRNAAASPLLHVEQELTVRSLQRRLGAGLAPADRS